MVPGTETGWVLPWVGMTKSQCNGVLFSLHLTNILVISEMANTEEVFKLWTECWAMLYCDNACVYSFFHTLCNLLLHQPTRSRTWQSGTRYPCEGKNWLPRGLSSWQIQAMKSIMIHGLVFEVLLPNPVLTQHLPLFVSKKMT